jgi:hypothetical protein
MFKDFDFAAIDSEDFKEDSVREEIIAPILKQLGFSASGPNRIQRSKNLVHPYVMIGSKKHKINIVPDYTLYVDDEPVAVIEAKGPTQTIFASEHVEQAYSYAIHPDVRVEYYGLCNGRDWILYSVFRWEPVLRVSISEIDKRWSDFEKKMLPKFLKSPELQAFMPDYGLTMRKVGFSKDLIQHFVLHHLQMIMKAEDDLYVANTTTDLDGAEYMVTLDLSEAKYLELLSKLPTEVAESIASDMRKAPFQSYLAGKVIVTVAGTFGEPTEGVYEEFIPIVVRDVSSVLFDPNVELNSYLP